MSALPRSIEITPTCRKFGLEFWKTVEAKKAGIVVADITDLQQPMVTGINADEMMYAACVALMEDLWRSSNASIGPSVSWKAKA
jgi:hypothetical protein